MGCVGSREAHLDRRRSPPSYCRSLSMPVVHGSQRKGDSLHVVSLTFSTLGSLRLDQNQDSFDPEIMNTNDRDQKAPKSIAAAGDVEQPEPESEMINTWELMEGLDECESPLPLQLSQANRSFSFETIRASPEPPPAISKSLVTSAAGSPKPLWIKTDQLDPEVITIFQKAMTELSPQHPTLRHRLSPAKYRPEEIPKFPGIVKARVADFQQKIDARRRSFKSNTSIKISPLKKPPSAGKGKVVLYSTSLRGVRKTYEDCLNAKAILQSYGVRIDERDVSMHGGFRDELSEILGAGTKLPKIFADGRYLGEAEEVEKMHESGELGEALKGCEMANGLKGSNGVDCEGCGDYRFRPCEVCWGSCKVFVEGEEDEIGGGFRRCMNCNENGLVRCPHCS
ncbi:uncharacterized protein At3g28850-like [Phalaenopsis equestris]|uniref:uncharacterized protein At3g28850-like n=1 Tax=Phalaenopsis equestris TaxID=78828 RepID=UPI0009E4BEB2|nr:uncharacterized protein At3g28850-like [Phalaenopsis equestris]